MYVVNSYFIMVIYDSSFHIEPQYFVVLSECTPLYVYSIVSSQWVTNGESINIYIQW